MLRQFFSKYSEIVNEFNWNNEQFKEFREILKRFAWNLKIKINIEIKTFFFLVFIAKLLRNLLEMMSYLKSFGRDWRNLKIKIKKVFKILRLR